MSGSEDIARRKGVKPEATQKPRKPYPDYPLFPHATGRWAKKILGRLHYFGVWADPEGALAKYREQAEALHAGRKPRQDASALTLRELCNTFLHHKQTLVDAGELSALTWRDYRLACDEVIAAFGKGRVVADIDPEDFTKLREQISTKWGHQRVSKTIQFIRCVFKFGYDAGLLDRPMRFGPGFKRPSRKVIRLHRAQQGKKLFTAEEVRQVLAAASMQVRAMIFLGINCGFGNSDCGNLPLTALDLERGWVDFPRPKTGVDRRASLWPETIIAIREAIDSRPSPKKEENGSLVFLTRCGDSWHTGTTDGPLSREFTKLVRKLGIKGRKGLGFYTLRHTFRTIADEAKDQPAADLIMGHESPHMSSIYRERISDERLKAVTDHVRKWLFGEGEGGQS